MDHLPTKPRRLDWLFHVGYWYTLDMDSYRWRGIYNRDPRLFLVRMSNHSNLRPVLRELLLRWRRLLRYLWCVVSDPKWSYQSYSHRHSKADHVQRTFCRLARCPRWCHLGQYTGHRLRRQHQDWLRMGPWAKIRCTQYWLSQNRYCLVCAWYRPNEM